MVIIFKTFFIYGFLAVFTWLERKFYYKFPSNWHRITKNYGFFAINALVAGLIIIPLTQYFTNLWHYRPDNSYFLLADILIYDLMIYGWHRLNHQIKFLWRFHQIHHYDNAIDVSTAVRFHFGEVILSAIFRIPIIIIFDMPNESIIIAETILLCASIFQHANWNLSPKWDKIISLIFITPAWHFLHHHAIQADTDSHYGNVFSFWDRIFQTRAQSKFRKANMIIGLQAKTDKDFMRLLKQPFLG